MNYDPQKPMTLEMVLADEKAQATLLDLGKRRYRASSEYVKPWHERWVRFYKIYRAIVDVVENDEEPNWMIAYAYGIIEDLVSQIVEPILQMRPPCRVSAKKAGQEQQAENFSAIAANYFASSRYQMEFTESTRELCIIGNAWEFDGWHEEYALGRIWKKVMQMTLVSKVKSYFSEKVFNLPPSEQPFEAPQEVEHSYPVKVGYHTRFPNAFDVYPEPGVKNVRDMHWILERERSVAIDDLKRKTYTDPATGERKSLFNFDALLKAAGQHEPGSIKPIAMEGAGGASRDYGQEARDAQLGTKEPQDSTNSNLDMDKVEIVWVWEQNRVYAIANGSFIVAYKENVFQIPRLPYRLKGYTGQKEFLYSTGAIEPIESQLYELNDIHRLSMRNWIRIINRMVAYNEEAVPFKDDFLPRAGGRIRVRPTPGGNVANEIVALQHQDVTQSMLAQESNTKGLIERELSVIDGSPGVEGTKPTHETLGGLREISRNAAKRATTIRRVILAGFQDQMWFMEKLYSQFMLEKQPFTIYGPDGSTRLSGFDLWDIATGGIGFDFVIEYDPSYGDDALLRNQNMVLLDYTIKYETARVTMGDGRLAKANLEEVMRRLYRSFGILDTSKMLYQPDGTMEPMAEFQLMMEGQPVAPNREEDLVKHLIEHTIQRNSPKFQKGLADGSLDPKAAALLDAHIQATEIMIDIVLRNPEVAAQAKIKQALMDSQGAQRKALPGAAGGDPVGSNTTSAAAGIQQNNLPQPTNRNMGQPEGV